MPSPRPFSKPALAVAGGLVAVAAGSYLGLSTHGHGDSPAQGFATCTMASLPVEAEDTADDILAGGPYDYPGKDNGHFGNYEGVLPDRGPNYYREYTVETPGLGHRGPRRIITGGGSETDPDVWYFTDDHYESFCTIPDAED